MGIRSSLVIELVDHLESGDQFLGSGACRLGLNLVNNLSRLIELSGLSGSHDFLREGKRVLSLLEAKRSSLIDDDGLDVETFVVRVFFFTSFQAFVDSFVGDAERSELFFGRHGTVLTSFAEVEMRSHGLRVQRAS